MATSPLVPGRLPVAIEDHAYQIEPSGFRRETVQVMRQQADTSTEPGEQSLNPAGLWRRSQESWHHGAGQEFLDGKTEEAADPHRFRSSKGVDVWTRGQVSLLHPTMEAWNTSATNLRLAVAGIAGSPGTYSLMMASGTEVYNNALPYGLITELSRQTGTGWTTTNATTPANGTYRMNIVATAAGAVSAEIGPGILPVDAGRNYRAAFNSTYVSGGAARVPSVGIIWYDAGGAEISRTAMTPGVGGITDTVNGHAYTPDTAAPANAVSAGVVISFTTNFAAGEVHRVNYAQLFPADSAGNQQAGWWIANDINAGQPAQSVQSLVSDGTNVWAALGTSGIHRTVAFGTTSTSDVPAAPAGGQIHLVGYANGFLLAAGSATSTTGKNTLWRIDNPMTAPTLVEIKTHHANFEWTGIGPGRNCVYAYGNSAGNGEVYKIVLDANTGTLATAASFATYLPEGETIHALQFYAGGIILGTGRGVRLGQADGAGNIDYGPLVETEWPVRCLEPQGRYCWFGWTKYDTLTSGLGRIDLGYFTDTLTPAWASDLMTHYQSTGDVTSCVTFTPYGYSSSQRPPVRVFAVAGDGVYIEDPYDRIGQGVLNTGTIRFSTSEPKKLRAVDVRHHALPTGTSVGSDVTFDDGTKTGLGTYATVGGYGTTFELSSTAAPAESFEVSLVLNRTAGDGTDFTRSPELTRWTAKALPQPSTIDETFTIPIILRREVVDNNDANYPVDVAAELTYLKGLERSRALVTLQLGAEQHTCYLAASQFEGSAWGRGKQQIEGVLTTIWQSVRG